MTTQRIHLCLADMGGRELDFVHEAFDTDWIVPLGPNVNGFEHDLEQYLGHDKYITALSSGTAAIHLALVLLGVGPGDEVICQSFTFAASANPITYQGATPVFVDSDPASWNMSPALLEEAILDRIQATGKRPKAIIVAHLYGMPAPMDQIMAIAKRHDIPVVEDAAEAMGSMFNGKPCGTFGHFGVLSFNGNKMITTSGGGALICPSEELKKRALFYATQARENVPYYQHEHIGYNYRMSNICAGIGRGQMLVVDDHVKHHRHVARLYEELLADTDGIELHTNPSPEYVSNYWLNTILIDPVKTGTDCDAVRLHLDAQGIESRLLWKPLHLQPVFSECPAYINGVSAHLFSRGLCLPSGPRVTDQNVEFIVNEIKRCVKK